MSSDKYGIDIDREGGQTLAIFGSSYSGKSSLLVYYVNNIVKAKIFDLIILFTESINSKPLEKLNKQVIKCLGYHADVVQIVYKINLKTNNRYKALFILDDCVKVRQNATLEKQLLLYRNSNITTILSTQYAKLYTAPSTRGSLHEIILTGGKTPEIRKQSYDLFLRSYLKGMTADGVDEFIMKNTELKPTGGKIIRIDNVRSEMDVIERPRIK